MSNYSNSNAKEEPDRSIVDDPLVDSAVLKSILTHKLSLYEQLHQVEEMAACSNLLRKQILDNFFASMEGT